MAVSMGRADAGTVARVRVALRAQGVDPFGSLIGGLAVIVILGILGIVHVSGVAHTWIVDLDAEFNVPALWSGGLLLTAALLAIELRHHERLRPVMGLAGLLGFMGIDEIATLHEHLERWSGVRWELLYVPLVALAALAVGVSWTRLGDTPWARPALAAGAACWVGAQALELAAWDGTTPVAAYDLLMVTEELGEMVGSLMFVVALLCIRRRWLVSDRR